MRRGQWCSYQNDDVSPQGSKCQWTPGLWGQKSCQELCSARRAVGVRTESVWEQLEELAMKGDRVPLNFQRLQAEMASRSWYFSGTWHQEQRKKHQEGCTEVISLQHLRRWVLLELYKDNEYITWGKNLLFRSFDNTNTPNACIQTRWSQNDLIYQQRQEEALHNKYPLLKSAISRSKPPGRGS